jgi:hypothetical protein
MKLLRIQEFLKMFKGKLDQHSSCDQDQLIDEDPDKQEKKETKISRSPKVRTFREKSSVRPKMFCYALM